MRTTIKTTARRTSRRARRAAIDTVAATLTEALRKLHGGQWAATVDHRNRFVLIRERRPKAA